MNLTIRQLCQVEFLLDQGWQISKHKIGQNIHKKMTSKNFVFDVGSDFGGTLELAESVARGLYNRDRDTRSKEYWGA